MLSRWISIFALVFLAEVPDKTAIASLVMAARMPVLPVLVGILAAFLIHCCIAVGFGSLIALLPATGVHVAAGLVFLGMAVVMFRRQGEEEDEEMAEAPTFLRIAATAFLVIFMAEWGDLTQLAIVSLSARYHAPLEVFTASVAALWSVTLLGVLLGSKLRDRMPPRLLERIAGAAFTVVGLWLIIEAVTRN
ncbi:MAG: TMEM165/GDT1 family protein [Candidatus Xenobia bacterium]